MSVISPTFSEELATQTALPADLATRGRWLNVVSHLDPKYGGLSTIVPQLCASLAGLRSGSVELAAFCAPEEAAERSDSFDFGVSYWPASRAQWWRRRDLREGFRDEARRVDGLHIHGLWEQSTDVAARTARRLRKPYVLSAHGMLDPWAIGNKRLKKAIYAKLFEHANVGGAGCLHALTVAEAEDYRRFGARAPIAVIPNAVCVPAATGEELFLSRFPELRAKRRVLFLGRIHFKKGLDILVDAWAAIHKNWPEAHLVLAGPDSEGTQARVIEQVRRLGLESVVTFTGMLDAPLKWSALAAAECFVLPSYSEGLSTSVLEAMGVGLPVIVTRQCHMPEVNQFEAGWEIQSTAHQLASALQEFLYASAASNRRIGANGRRLVESRYSWHSVAERMSSVYEWLAGGAAPTSVDLRVT